MIQRSIFQRYKDLVLAFVGKSTDICYGLNTSLIDSANCLTVTSGQLAVQDGKYLIKVTLSYQLTGINPLETPIEGNYTYWCPTEQWEVFTKAVQEYMETVSFGKPTLIGVRDIEHLLRGYGVKFHDLTYMKDGIAVIQEGKPLISAPFIQ